MQPTKQIMNERYLEFDRHAWWWYRQIYLEADPLGIASPDELKRIDAISDEYGYNLMECTEATNTLGTALLVRHTIRITHGILSRWRRHARKLNDLNGQRYNLVMESAHMFISK
jgi:hypothetical protein